MLGNGSKSALRRMIRADAEALSRWIEGFLRDCRVRELSPFTIIYYRAALTHFEKFCRAQGVSAIADITADLIRAYMLDLEATGHNPGGRRTKHRALTSFFNWYQAEAEPQGWTNPISKVKPPKVERELIEGASIEDVRALLATCDHSFLGVRDQAVILALIDTGARAGEFLAINLDDVDTVSGAVILRKTKAKRARVVFLGKKARKALRAYLKQRHDESPALWISRRGDRLAMKSLQGLLKRRGKFARLRNTPSPHDFRRAHALMMLRAGTDIVTLSRLMGHTGLEVLKRYLAQNTDDLQAAHEKASPADRIF